MVCEGGDDGPNPSEVPPSLRGVVTPAHFGGRSEDGVNLVDLERRPGLSVTSGRRP